MGRVIQTVADSIAIELLDDTVILTGKGNELHLYNRNKSPGNVFKVQVLDIKLRNKIHGIRKLQNSANKIVLIYGEKEFALLNYNNSYDFIEFYRAELSDWISCGTFLNDSEEIVLLTAHSIILRFSYDIVTGKCCLKERVSCTDKSTLYCGHLCAQNWRDLIVFAGNAFGELLIWQPSRNSENEVDPSKPKESNLLHRIPAHNGVIFSIDFDEETHYLVTTSDDRAIKWWKVNFKNAIDWNDSKLQALSSGYGHVARVFQGRIIKDGSHAYAISVGEDSYFCLWHRNGQLLFKRRQQYGATIWNFVYDSNTKTIYTVGSVGNLVAFGLNHVLQETQQSLNVQLLPNVMTDHCTEYIAKVKFLNEKHLIGVTNQNRLMCSVHDREQWNEWKPLDIKVDFKCTVMEVFDNRVAICGYKRMILLECHELSGEFSMIYDENLLKGVIRTFVFFTKDQFLICDDQGDCILILETFDKKRSLELVKCKEPWLTTGVLLNQQRHIVISNRQGNVLLYQLQDGGRNYNLKQIIKHPHGNLGATNLHCLEESNTTAIIRSTGHDGALNIFFVDFTSNTIKICSRHIVPVVWVEHIIKLNTDIELFLGFNDNHFVTWCKQYDLLLQLPCGGGHRCWHFVLDPATSQISLAFIKNKRVHFYKRRLLNDALTQLPLATRWHVTPCNAIALLRGDVQMPHILVSAGDDNLLKIHTFSNQGLQEQQESHQHISNIRALKVLSIDNKEFVIFSGGGRAQLCVTKVHKSNFNINELINFTLNQDNKKKTKSNFYNFDPETRLMSLDVKVINEDEYHVYVGCSDGFIRYLNLNLKTLHVQLITQYFYNSCILQIRYIPEADYILAGATDGFLKLFDSNLSKCVHQVQHHCSGVNSLSILYNSSTKSLQILSGGDDQAVSYTELSLADLDFKILSRFHKPYLHTAQVCACALSPNGLYGFTSGVDQVLNKIDLVTGEVVDAFYSCVADIKGVALIEENTCALYGCGLQIYAFNC